MATMASFHNKLMNLEARLRAENEARSRDRLPRDLTTGFTSPQHTPRPRLKTRKFTPINVLFTFFYGTKTRNHVQYLIDNDI